MGGGVVAAMLGFDDGSRVHTEARNKTIESVVRAPRRQLPVRATGSKLYEASSPLVNDIGVLRGKITSTIGGLPHGQSSPPPRSHGHIHDGHPATLELPALSARRAREYRRARLYIRRLSHILYAPPWKYKVQLMKLTRVFAPARSSLQLCM